MNSLESGFMTDRERISTTETETKEAEIGTEKETADVTVTEPVIREIETAVTVLMTESAVERGKEVNMSMRVMVVYHQTNFQSCDVRSIDYFICSLYSTYDNQNFEYI